MRRGDQGANDVALRQRVRVARAPAAEKEQLHCVVALGPAKAMAKGLTDRLFAVGADDILLDRGKLTETGAATFAFGPRGVIWSTARAPGEDRPWSRAPRPRATAFARTKTGVREAVDTRIDAPED